MDFPRIAVDFNRLGYYETDGIPLGGADERGFLGVVPQEGMAAIFFQPGELEMYGVLHQRMLLSGAMIWEAVVDLTTRRDYYVVAPDGTIVLTSLGEADAERAKTGYGQHVIAGE